MITNYALSQAAYCRRLALRTQDARSRKTLLEVADEYQREAAGALEPDGDLGTLLAPSKMAVSERTAGQRGGGKQPRG
jgi:hypothetical protein